MSTSNKKIESRMRRRKRIRKHVAGDNERPRLTVFRSNKHIYAQVIDDTVNKAVASASTATKGLSGELQGKSKKDQAKLVGAAVAKACKDNGINKVVFDRNGYAYHGRVSALAEGAREGGLEF
jgi:large subunit ribosomal protein L18